MLRVALFAAAFVFGMVATALAQDWSGISPIVSPGVVRLEASVDGESEAGESCSAAIINKAKGYILTAAHCVPVVEEGRSITVGDLHAEVEKINYLLDLAILQVEGLKGGQLELRDVDIEVGTAVAFAGFAFGSRSPKFTFGHISDMREPNMPTRLLIDAVVIPGHSGGVVVDRDGRLVGTAQAYLFAGLFGQSAHLAVSSNTATVRAFAKHYLAPPSLKARK